MHEEELVRRLKKHDEKVYGELIRHYQVPLIRLCTGFLHNKEDARDVTQDTFVQVIETIGQFREEASFSTWIYRIAVNKSLNLLRKKKLRKFLHLDHTTAVNQSAPAHSRLEDSDRIKYIRMALDKLPENQRIAFVLNKYLEHSYKEIAGIMNISVPAVESLIHRAKMGLQKLLYRYYKNNLL